MNKTIAVSFMCAALYGCTSGIEIINQGDVYSSSGAYNCSTEYSPCTFTTTTAIDETFTAIPRQNFLFAGWRHCPESNRNVCHVQISQETVNQNVGKTYPPLVAMFAPTGSIKAVVATCDTHPSLSWREHCSAYVNRTVFVYATPDNANTRGYLQVIGWDNQMYEGGWSGLYKASNGDGMFAGRPSGKWIFFKTSASYDCQGQDGCGVTLTAVDL